MGKAQDDEARPVAAQAPHRGARPRAPSPGPTGRVAPAVGRGRAPDTPPHPVPAGRPDPPRPGGEEVALRAPSRPDTPCTRGRRAGPPAGTWAHQPRPVGIKERRRDRQGGTAGPPRATRGPRRRAHGKPLREPLAQLGRARLRPLAPIVVETAGARASIGPTSAAGGSPAPPTRFRKVRISPAAGACASRPRPSHATVCVAPWCWAESCCSFCCSL